MHPIVLVFLLGCTYPSVAQGICNKSSFYLHPQASEALGIGLHTVNAFLLGRPWEAAEGVFQGRMMHWRTPVSDEDMRGYDALVLGWDTGDAEADKRHRADAERAFGREWVALYERATEDARRVSSGMRMVRQFYGTPGGDATDALDAFRRDFGDRKIRSNGDAWDAFSRRRLAQIREAEDKSAKETSRTPISDTVKRGYDALVFGWATGEAEINTRRRQDAVNAFGEEWVALYEQSPEEDRQLAAGMRMVRQLYGTPGGDELDALDAFRRAYGNSSIMEEASAWNLYASRRRAQIGLVEALKVEKARKLREQKEAEEKARRERAWEEKRKKEKAIMSIGIAIGSVTGLTLLMKTIRKAMSSALSREQQLTLWAALVSIILLLIAIIGGSRRFLWDNYDLPAGYYTMLRLGVTAAGLYMTCIAARQKKPILIILLSAALSLLFQPLILISFKHDTWLWIDLAAIPVIILIAVQLTRSRKQPQ